MEDEIKTAIMASFVADALSLGVHWVYDRAQIKDKYGRLEEMTDPVIAPYHKGKSKGEFTHYGDQMLVLLDSLVHAFPFDVYDFGERWQVLFAEYSGYMDHATKETLANMGAGKEMDAAGSASSDLSGAARIAPLLLGLGGDESALIYAARQQTAMTHNHPMVVETAEWAARTLGLILRGDSPTLAMSRALEAMPGATGLARMVEKGLGSADRDTAVAIGGFGQMCDIEAALPGVVHLTARYEQDLETALVENIMAGGDSSARGMLVAAFIGAFVGGGAIPRRWLDQMAATPRIYQLISLV